MKKFITYWSCLVLAGHIIPSLIVAVGMTYFYGGDAPSAQSPLAFGIGMFILVFWMIAQTFIWPAVIVLCLGVVCINNMRIDLS